MYQFIIKEDTVLNNKEKNEQNQSAYIDQKKVGANVGFARIRRITGYLVGTLDRFNNAKRAEEKDRVKHGCS